MRKAVPENKSLPCPFLLLQVEVEESLQTLSVESLQTAQWIF